MKTNTLECSKKFVLPTYNRLPIALVKGKGTQVWDEKGKKYLDFISGIAVNNLGHSDPRIVKTIKNQSSKLIHVSNLFYIQAQASLAQQLVQLSGLSQAFFANSGAEAIEASIKLARYWSIKKFGKHRFGIISCTDSFHGRTLGALSATGQKKYTTGFGPLVPGFKKIPFNDPHKLRRAITKKTCAFLVEPIQCEGGLIFPSKDYLKEVKKICIDNNLLLILDEVQTGMGRTGRFFASQYYGVKPDIIALSKALGSGLPISCCLVSKEVASIVALGIHASTFGGNPLSCSVAQETVNILSQKKFLKNVQEKGSYFISQLKKIQNRSSLIQDVGGLGLMVRCELAKDNGSLVAQECLKKGLLINVIKNRIIRFVPPLTVTKSEIDRACSILESVLSV